MKRPVQGVLDRPLLFQLLKLQHIFVLELKIDKGLDVARLDLHDAPRNHNKHCHLPPETRLAHLLRELHIDPFGHKVHHISRRNHRKDNTIAHNNLRNNSKVEIMYYLIEHQMHLLHRFGTEQQPPEAYNMESKEDAHKSHHGH